MTKTILLSSILALTLSASTIDFNDATQVDNRTMPSNSQSILSYNSAIKTATQSIVYIAVKQKMQQGGNKAPFLEQFFGSRQNPYNQQPQQGLGSGVIISKEGYIVTNYHVVENADEITVRINGETQEYEAEIIGKDPKSDLAVIKVKSDHELQPILMGYSNHLEIGDIVFAIGNPFGVGQSVTMGIISAQHKDSVGINEYENFIQTDASINPGNSGGALVDSRGALIGINSAIMTRSGGNNGIGFAIEVDMVRNIVKQLIETGSIQRGFLGVSIGNLTKELRNLYKSQEGAMVLQVTIDSPAAKAGLQRGDLILSVNDQKVTSAAALKNSIGGFQPKSKVRIVYERDKVDHTTTVVLSDLSSGNVLAQNSEGLIKGLHLSNLDQKTRLQYKITEDIEGVLITKVAHSSQAFEQNLQAGDIIMQVEKSLTPDIKTLSKVLQQYEGEYKRVYINRGGHIYVTALK